MVPPALLVGFPKFGWFDRPTIQTLTFHIRISNRVRRDSRVRFGMIDRAHAWTQRMRLTFETRFASRRSRDSQTARLERLGQGRRGEVLHHACPCRRAACVVRPRRRVSRRKYQNRTTCSPLFLGPSSVIRDNLGALRGAPVFGPDERVQIWTKHAEIWGPRPDVGSPQVTMKFSRVRWDCSLVRVVF